MLAIKGIYDGKMIQLLEEVPQDQEGEVIITFTKNKIVNRENETHEEYLRRKRSLKLPSYDVGGRFDNIDLRKAAYEE